MVRVVQQKPPTIINKKTTVKKMDEDSTDNLFDSIVPVSELEGTGYKFLIFGVSGTGKTTLACDFPKPLYLIRPEEVEDGSLSVRTVPGVYSSSVAMTDPNQLMDICEGQRRTNKFKTIVLDGVLAVQDLVVKKHMGLDDVPVQLSYGQVPQADWNRIGITLKGYFKELMKLADMGTHIVLVGDERVVGDGDTNVDILLPSVQVALSPGTSGWLHRMCDFNVHTFKRRGLIERTVKINGKEKTKKIPEGPVEYCLHVDTHDLYATKFRKPKGVKLPADIADPTFSKLEKLIKPVQTMVKE